MNKWQAMGADEHDLSYFITKEDYNDPVKRKEVEDRGRRAFANHGEEHRRRGEPDETIDPESVTLSWAERRNSMQLYMVGYCSCVRLRGAA